MNYEIDFVLVENMTNDKAIELYQSADIIIDQLLIGTYGVFACEAMALGKPVVTYISQEMKSEFPDELPIVSANIENIESKLEMLINNAKLRNDIGISGRKYVEKYHDFKNVAKLAKHIYDKENVECSQKETFLLVDSGQ